MLCFQTEIINWWQEVFNKFLVLKLKLDFECSQERNWMRTNEKKYLGIYVLSMVPAFGFLLALTVFICYDLNGIQNTFYCCQNMWRLPRKSDSRKTPVESI